MNRSWRNHTRLAAAATALVLLAGVIVGAGSMSAAPPDDDPPAPTEAPDVSAPQPPTEAAEVVDVVVEEEPPAPEEPESTPAAEVIHGEVIEEVPEPAPPTEPNEPAAEVIHGEVQEEPEAASLGPSTTRLSVVGGTPVYGQATTLRAEVWDSRASCLEDNDCVHPTGTVHFEEYFGEWAVSAALTPDATFTNKSSAYVDVFLHGGDNLLRAEYVPGNLESSFNVEEFPAAKAECTATLTGPDSGTSTAGDAVVFAADVTSNSEHGIVSGGTLTMWLNVGGEKVNLREIKPFNPPGDVELSTLPAGTNSVLFDYADANHDLCTSNEVIHEVVEPVVANDDVEVAYQYNPFGLGVLYNDENAESIVSIGTPTNGTAEVVWDEPNDSEIVKYTPNPGFVGQDAFTYTASNGAGHTDTATVTVDVRPFRAVDDEATTTEGEALELAVFDNDAGYDEYTSIVVDDAPAHGVVDLHPCTTLSSDTCVTYTPNAGFAGTDSFGYELTKSSYGDIHAKTSATVTVTVTPAASSSTMTTTTTTTTTIAPPAGNGPVAVDDSFEATADGVLMVGAPGVLANDLHSDGAPLTAQLAGDAAHGTVVLNADGSFAYTPNAGFVGTDSFSYVASDGGPFAFAPAGQSRGMAPGAVSAPATVLITVNPASPTTTTPTTSSTTTATTPTTPAGTLPATR